MATAPDPFFVVKEDVEGATEGLLSLFDRYQTLMNQSDNSQDEELQWTVSELKTGIKSVEYDLDCLNETVEIVEEKRDKFKIDENELYNRKKYIRDTRSKISKMKNGLKSAEQTKLRKEKDNLFKSSSTNKRSKHNDRYKKLEEALEEDNERFINKELQSQQQMFEQQDEGLTELHKSLKNVGHLTNEMNKHLQEDIQIMEDLETDVDSATGRLKSVMKKVDSFLYQKEGKVSWMVLGVLIVIFLVLLIIVIKIPSS